jgi:hypothetical protein
MMRASECEERRTKRIRGRMESYTFTLIARDASNRPNPKFKYKMP